jgi:FkbM family methyltransferase
MRGKGDSAFQLGRYVNNIRKAVQQLQNKLAAGHIRKGDFYDYLTELVIMASVSKEAICVDVGCHAGSILEMMMRYASNGQFYAFEPIPHLFSRLTKRFGNPRVHIFDIALSDKEGRSTFNYVVSNPGYSGLKKRHYDRPCEVDREITVRTDLLDNIIDEGSCVSLIKIDVEGGEYQVLRGGRNIIARSRPVVIFEHGIRAAGVYGTTPQHIYEFFEECSLDISLLDSYLLGKSTLDGRAFCAQVENGLNYQFVAHKRE